MRRFSWALVMIVTIMLARPDGGMARATDPSETVSRFYQWYLKVGGIYPAVESFSQARGRFTPGLYTALVAAFAGSPTYGHDHNGFDFDPFTNSGLSAITYKLGPQTVSGTIATIPVTVRLQSFQNERPSARIIVELQRSGQTWLISDFIYAAGTPRFTIERANTRLSAFLKRVNAPSH